MRGLHYNVQMKRSVGPVAVGTTGTGTAGKIVDRKGFNQVEFILSYGAITATSAVFTVIAKEGDATGSMTSIADADLDGTELAAGIAAGTPRTSDSNKLVTKRLGYRGIKRYVQLTIKSTITATPPVFGGVLLSRPEQAPVAT